MPKEERDFAENQNWEDIHWKFKYYSWLQEDWKSHDLTYQETKPWIETGLTPKEYKFAFWLKQNNYQPSNLTKTIEELRKEHWLNTKYPNKQETKGIWIDWKKENIHGSLTVVDYPNLETISINQHCELANLQIINCPNLKELIIYRSQLINLDLSEASNLEILNLSENSLTNLNLTNNQKLKELVVSWNNLTNLNINHLKDLEKLNVGGNNLAELNISNLVNLKELYCSSNNLTNLDLSQNEKLEVLSLGDFFRGNNFNQELFPLKGLLNLKELSLGNNSFKGNLEPLKDMNDLEWLNISNTDIDSGLEYLPEDVKYFDCSVEYRKDAKVKAIYNLFASEQRIVEIEGNGCIKNFIQKLQEYKNWRKFNFTEKVIKEWINAGATLSDYRFIIWLREAKGYGLEWITNYQGDYRILCNRFKRYGLCPSCKEPNTGEKWCQDCNKSRLERLALPASNNPQLNELIQKKYQLEATEENKFLEWIPYEQFMNIEYLAKGGFGKVYKAEWREGNINYWNAESNQWQRKKDDNENHRKIVLKSLNNSSKNTKFLQEAEKHKIIDDWFQNIVPCYGISQDPETGNYLMAMQYMPKGNLRHYLSNKNHELSLKDKVSQLFHIAQGLKDIHAKNLVHQDFHSGNILKGIEKTSCLITDLGLCKPVDEISQEDKVFGVMPYVAPEVLRSKPYTQASDIYSFGIIAYEVLSGLPPYYDQAHDLQLALAICQGQRPQFQIKIPQLLTGLIKQCWNTDPAKRLTANELEKILRKWEQENEEFAQQLQEAEKYNKNLPDEIKLLNYKKKMHSGAVYHSRLLPTKEISKLLSQSQIISEQSYELKETSDLVSCAIDLKKLNIKDDSDNSQITENWQNLHPNLTPQLIQSWLDHNFTYSQTQEWINIGLTPEDYQFAHFLKSQKNLTSEEVLNYHNLENLRNEFINYQQNNQQAQIIQTNPNK